MHMGYAPPPLQNTEEQSLFLVAVPQPQKGHFCDPGLEAKGGWQLATPQW